MFNKVNYPNLLQMFDKLQVPYVESSMSFGASIAGGRIEYGLASLDAIFAQRKNIASPRFLRMNRDVVHFNKNALAVVKPGMTVTKEQVMEHMRANVTGYKVPRFIEFRDTLPTTNVGKILRRELRDEELKKQGLKKIA